MSAVSALPQTMTPKMRADIGRALNAFAAGAVQNSNIASWRPALRSIDAEVMRDAPTIRARARDLVRNNAIARQAVRISRIATIGADFRLKLKPDHLYLGIKSEEAFRWAREVERVWRGYAHGTNFWVDAGRRMTFTDMMNMGHDQDFIDGEAILVSEWDERRPWFSCFHFIDSDRLSNPHGSPETSQMKGGVELDHLGAPIGYHIRNAHPSEHGIVPTMSQLTWSRVPRETPWYRMVVAHTFDGMRPGQTRGISEFASVVQALKMGQEYQEQELATSAARATFLAVMTSSANMAEAWGMVGENSSTIDPETGDVIPAAMAAFEASIDYAAELGLTVNGQKIPKLAPGDKMEFLNPGHPGGSYSEFTRSNHYLVSSGLGVDPIALTQDYSKANYSSSKLSDANNGRTAETRRGRLIRTVAMPMFAAWLEEAIMRGIIDMPDGLTPADFHAAKDHLCRGTFITASRAMLDPHRERQAQQMGISLGVETLESVCAEEGEDWRENLEQRAAEMAYANELGVLLPGSMPLPGQVGAAPVADDPDASDEVDPAEKEQDNSMENV